MPKEIFGRDYEFMRQAELLTFEEIARLAGVAVSLGARKIRLTGGEPLLRRHLHRLVGMLREIEGLRELTLTTNGALLATQVQALKDAGLDRVTVSLDSLDDATFRRMNDVDFPVTRVLDAIDKASEIGLGPVKVNAVVKRGENDGEIEKMAEHFRGTGHILRFIEYMDVGTTNGWQMGEVVPASEIVDRIGKRFPLEPVAPNYAGEVVSRYRYIDGKGEIGVITSVTRPFCGGCTRARLSCDGLLYTCLFASRGLDLKTPLREGASDIELRTLIESSWTARSDRYSEERTTRTTPHTKIEMSYIGG